MDFEARWVEVALPMRAGAWPLRRSKLFTAPLQPSAPAALGFELLFDWLQGPRF